MRRPPKNDGYDQDHNNRGDDDVLTSYEHRGAETDIIKRRRKQQHGALERPQTANNQGEKSHPYNDSISPLMERSLLDEIVSSTHRRRRRSPRGSPSRASSSRFNEHDDAAASDFGLSSSTNFISRFDKSHLAKHTMMEKEEHRRYTNPAPPLNDFLLEDDAYRDLLLGNKQKKSIYDGLQHVNGVDVATGCAWFSGIGMMFLLFVGFLIQSQPFYINGIKQQRQGNSYREKMKKYTISIVYEDDNIISGSDNTRGGEFSTPKMGGRRTQWESVKNSYKNGNDDYKMIKEASNAFKAAAAYFLTLVLSLTYIQIHDKISFDIKSMLITPSHLRYYWLSIYRKYHRRNYINIPDTSSNVPDFHVYAEPDGNVYQQGRSYGIWSKMIKLKSRVLERRKTANRKKRK